MVILIIPVHSILYTTERSRHCTATWDGSVRHRRDRLEIVSPWAMLAWLSV
jgi:hypothetical protein